MTSIKAVKPYLYEGQINFKQKPYEAWKELGGATANSHYPCRFLHGLAFRFELPTIRRSTIEARLRFVQPWSLSFDTYPDYALYEIIPFFWDCWPDNFDIVFSWLHKHNVQTAIFTSAQFAEIVRSRFPQMNVLYITEGIDIATYKKGKDLSKRSIDLLEYGREIDNIVKYDIPGLNHVKGKINGQIVFTQQQLIESLSDSRIVAAYPKSWTNPEQAGGIETLTQRFWECMLSRCVMVGHAPKEMIDLIGYNPVIEIDKKDPCGQVMEILSNIQDYQDFVNKNLISALRYGDWKYSIKVVMQYLTNCGYQIYG